MLNRIPVKGDRLMRIEDGLVLIVKTVGDVPCVITPQGKMSFGERTFNQRKHMFNLLPKQQAVPVLVPEQEPVLDSEQVNQNNIKTFKITNEDDVQVGELRINISMLGSTSTVTVVPLEQETPSRPLVVSVPLQKDTLKKCKTNNDGTWSV